MNQPVQTSGSDIVEQVTDTVRQGVQAASDKISGKPEGVRETIAHAFGDSATGPKWGAVGGASIITLVTGLLGFTMGGPLGALAGVAGGLTIGTLIGPALNGMWEKMGFPATEKPPMPNRAPEAQADPDVGKLRGMDISQPGTPLPDKTKMLVPNLDRFKQVSSESAGLVSDLVKRRADIDAMPHSARREGAIKRLLVDETGASKLLANAQLWDQMVAEWSKPGGERDKLKTALGAAMNANGQRFDESMIPTPPVAKIRAPMLHSYQEQYALDMMQQEGKTKADWDAMRPQEKLNYIWNKTEADAEANKFDWGKMGHRLANIPISPRWNQRSPVGMASEVAAWATSFAGDWGKRKAEAIREVINTQSDVVVLAREAYEKKDYFSLMCYAKIGQRATEELHWFGNDPEAKAEFEKLQNYARAKLYQEEVSGKYEQLYQEIQRVEGVAKSGFPKFIADVEKLEAQVRELNARTQEKNRRLAAAAEVSAPTSAPSTPIKTTAVEEDKAPAATPSH